MIHQLTIHAGDFAGIINILTVSITRFFLLEMITNGVEGAAAGEVG